MLRADAWKPTRGTSMALGILEMLDLKALVETVAARCEGKHAATLRALVSSSKDKCGFEIEGATFVASVGVWVNGCCDFDFLDLRSKQTQAWHYEFHCFEDAARCVAHDIIHLPSSARNAAGPIAHA